MPVPVTIPDSLNMTRYAVPEDGKLAVICDLDGTIAFNEERAANMARKVYDYTNVRQDNLDSRMLRALLHMTRGTEHIIFMSGRPERAREDTVLWIDQYLTDYTLLMRKDHDHRPEWEVKLELFNRYVRDEYDVIAAFDNRSSTVAMYRKLGILTLQVADDNF